MCEPTHTNMCMQKVLWILGKKYIVILWKLAYTNNEDRSHADNQMPSCYVMSWDVAFPPLYVFFILIHILV